MARRTKIQREKDLMETSRLYLSGIAQAIIAERQGLDQSTISNDLAELRNRWQVSALVDFDTARTSELAKIDNLERTYWESWERSREGAETSTQKLYGEIVKRQGEDGKFVATRPAVVIKANKTKVGNPQFLLGVERCIDRRIKIFGLDAPQQIEVYDWRADALANGKDPTEIEAMAQNFFAKAGQDVVSDSD